VVLDSPLPILSNPYSFFDDPEPNEIGLFSESVAGFPHGGSKPLKGLWFLTDDLIIIEELLEFLFSRLDEHLCHGHEIIVLDKEMGGEFVVDGLEFADVLFKKHIR
jgi:hypothetical protein